jgi:hypothetical protein
MFSVDKIVIVLSTDIKCEVLIMIKYSEVFSDYQLCQYEIHFRGSLVFSLK